MLPETSRAEQLEIARGIALRLLDARSWSEAELRDRLALRGIPEDVSGELTERFREVGLLDDAAFAEALTQTRVQVDRFRRFFIFFLTFIKFLLL